MASRSQFSCPNGMMCLHKKDAVPERGWGSLAAYVPAYSSRPLSENSGFIAKIFRKLAFKEAFQQAS